MYRFFVNREDISEGEIRIYGDEVNHIKNVLRMKPGETVLLSCRDEWEYTCSIKELTDDVVICAIQDAQKAGRELSSRIYLFQCLPKGDKMETVIQKAVELGVYQVIPVASKRCVVKLDEKKAKNKIRRWNSIAESAASQSKRMIIPEVTNVMDFRTALRYAEEHAEVRLMPYEMAEGMDATRKLMGNIQPGQSVAIFIGPEGGFEETEVALAAESGYQPITLGKRILRTETAGMMVLSMLVYLLEEN